jgi:vancomycin resistance protein YoaR
LPVATLAGLVTTKPDGGRLLVELDPGGLREALLPRLGRFERAPTDARFVVDARSVRLVRASPGKKIDADRIGASLVGNLTARAHRARFAVSRPAFTTEAAEKLRITELVSEFTTYYPCCAPRVTNIKRAAELLDGTIILPGKEFSLNEALGKRTEKKGFVSAPQIFNGKFEDAVGGGISQVATTLFNAAFFSGIKLVEHRAHQFYISRYPMGREATVSWGGPELIFKNDWPAAILMKIEATDSGITVRFFSTKLGRRVTTTTGKPYLPTTPGTVTVTNPALPAGTRKVVQEAGDGGFTIDFTRKVFRDGKRIRNELYRQKYDAEDEIVEVGTG